MKTFSLLFILMTLVSCSHSKIYGPHQYSDGRTVYVYEGRANFAHQLRAAQEKMQDQCNEVNPGSKPVEYIKEENSIGLVEIVPGSAVKTNCTIGRRTASCTQTGGSEPTYMDNRQMMVEFACEK